MNKLQIKPYRRIVPMIYAYTIPELDYDIGWSKIGYTATQTVRKRIAQQTHTAGIKVNLLWKDNAIYKDGSGKAFTDHDFHRYLTDKAHIERRPKTEWFHVDGVKSKALFDKFANRDFSDVQTKGTSDYTLRNEQQSAVNETKEYFEEHGKNSEFLWNAKPRFGKTLSAYDLARQMNMKNVLVVTNRPSIAHSWLDDFVRFIGWQTNYKFVSDNSALKESEVLSPKEFENLNNCGDYRQIAFESLQNLKGSIYFGGNYNKLQWIKDLHWDMLIIDEAHEGVETYKTDKAFNKIDRDYTLYLTGTPFKALAEGKFSQKQIFNWSYADEQKTKAAWNNDESNPYIGLPRLNMYTYQMSEMMTKKAQEKVALDDENQVDPAFDLNEFFRTKANGEFVYDDEVDHFLYTLTHGEKYPFSTPKLRNTLKHTFWLLSRVASAKALYKKLIKDEIFKDYHVIVAAGDGKLDDGQMTDEQADQANQDTFKRVKKAIKKYPKTITLSVGQLTTGVTIPEWTGVLMLSNMKSPAEYMQAAFRAQNPCIFKFGTEYLRKENAYVFDFDPARTLTIFDEFANNLLAKTAGGRGTAQEHAKNIRKLLNFFPVIGEDDNGEMVPLNAKQIMSIPRQLKSREVVKHGFMSNFLFTNIGRIFNAPEIVHNILDNLHKAKEENRKQSSDLDNLDSVPVDNNGNVTIDHERVIGKSKELFGNKIYQDLGKKINDAASALDNANVDDTESVTKQVNDLTNQMSQNYTSRIIKRVQDDYGLSKSEANKYQKQLNKENKDQFNKLIDHFNDEKKLANAEHNKQQQNAQTEQDLANARKDYTDKMHNIMHDFTSKVQKQVNNVIENTPNEIIKRVEQHKAEEQKKSVEEDARAHLRGFSRTIPSFIMAYGDRKLTLQNFDRYTDPDVFKEVTGITLDQFKFLRDGGDYIDQETGETKHFEGHLFDEVVFDDSIQQFLDMKYKLRNYFDESNKEDIFDYIPPQKTNQIFTPKKVVKKMVDDLEENDPHIFEDPNKTFADLYMKSGLYITEIIKRLYANDRMKQLYPDNHQRLLHIMNNQVYGLAPTKIIYLIATNYIFGFDDSLQKEINRDHFKLADAAEYAKKGTLQELVDKIFN